MSDETRNAHGFPSMACIGTVSVNGEPAAFTTVAEMLSEDQVADQKITADAVREYWSRRFDYRRPIGDQFIRHQLIRMHAANFAESLLEHAPASSELTRSLERLQEVVGLAIAAIACNETPPEGVA